MTGTDKIYDLIIIGGGPAGMTAGIYAARKKLKTLILTQDIGGQATWSNDIENYTGFTVTTGTELVKKFEEHLERFNDIVELRLTTSGVSSIKKSDHVFTLTSGSGQTDRARAIIIACGRRPRQLGLIGEKEFLNRGVTYCAWCDGPIFAGKNVAIIGGGNSALDAALSVANIVKQIYLVNITDQLTADTVLIDKAQAMTNIRIFNQSEAKAIEGDKFVQSLTIIDRENGKERELAVEGVFIEVGGVPATDFLKGLVDLNDEGEIIIDRDNMSSRAGIFAAGDVTDVTEKQIIIAAGEGAKATIAATKWLAKN